jgi:cell division protein FtsB
MTTAVLIMMCIFSVPLAGIISKTYLKRLELLAQSPPDQQKKLEALTIESAELRQRIETLETIATSSTGLEAQSDQEVLERMEAMSKARSR